MFLSPYSLTPTHLHGAEVGRGTGKGEGGEVLFGSTLHCKHTLRCTWVWHDTANILSHKHTPERAHELDVKSPEQKKEEGENTHLLQQTHTLFLMRINKHTGVPRALLPNGVTSLHHPLRDAGGRFASAGTAQRSVTGETAMLCFCHQRWWQRNCLCNAPGSFLAH